MERLRVEAQFYLQHFKVQIVVMPYHRVRIVHINLHDAIAIYSENLFEGFSHRQHVEATNLLLFRNVLSSP